MRLLLELIRIIFLFIIIGGILGYLIQSVYMSLGVDNENYGRMAFLSIFIFFFLFYRNKWQFSGWYKGKGRKKLPVYLTRILAVIAILFLTLPVILLLLEGNYER